MLQQLWLQQDCELDEGLLLNQEADEANEPIRLLRLRQ
jgi:hypothetical protein